ncbi:MAG TPA: TIGR02996 domain-containing protein [Kofleriaceae bacterium]
MQLEAVLERWRETRDPALARVIRELGGPPDPDIAAAFAKLKPVALVKATIDALQPTNATYGPAQLVSLIPVVERVVREAAGSWPVVELIAELPADPRVAELGLRLVGEFDRLTRTSAKLLRRLLDVIEHHGDPSCIAPLEAVELAVPAPATLTRIANIVKRLAKATPLTKQQWAELESARIEPVAPEGPALLEAVYGEPASDAARAVYADYLLGQNDPRGEFIQLQLLRAEGKATDATTKRETALLRKHATAWLGPLEAVIQRNHSVRPREILPTELEVPIDALRGTTFARGFVRRIATVYVPKNRTGTYDEPMWATIEQVASIAKLTPVMRSLQIVDHANLSLLDLDRSWDSIGLAMGDIKQLVRHGDEAKLLAARFANLRTRRLLLRVNWGDWERVTAVIRAAANPGLKEIVLEGDAPKALERTFGWRALRLPDLETVTLATRNGDVVIDRTRDHVDVYPVEADPATWDCVLGGIWDPFETATIHGDDQKVIAYARGAANRYKIANRIT